MLKKTGGRIVNLASIAATRAKIDDVKLLNTHAGWTQYGITKLCNILYTIELAKRLKGTQATTYSVHPGVVLTDFFRVIPRVRYLVESLLVSFAKVLFYIFILLSN